MGLGIEAVSLTPLRKIHHEKGDIYHALKRSDDGFVDFGEAYFSCVNHGEIKGWKKHETMTLNVVVPVGAIKFVVYDDKTGSFFEAVLSQENYQRLTVPPKLWMAFCGVGTGMNMLLNIASIEHNPHESENRHWEAIPYDWTL